MKVLYKCTWKHWGRISTKPCLSYYLEIPEKEFTDELMGLLSDENEQIEYQLDRFKNIYIIIDRNLKYAMCIPSGYGPHWGASGHWNMQKPFYNMYGVEISKLKDLKHLEKDLLEHSIEYLKTNDGKFGNLNQFYFETDGPEYFKSNIAESIVYHYYNNMGKNPIIPNKETTYRFEVDKKKILIKTTGAFTENRYTGYGENSFWKIHEEFKSNDWDILYIVPITWSENKYTRGNMYKITHDGFYNINTDFMQEIMQKPEWYVPVKIDDWDWINNYRIFDNRKIIIHTYIWGPSDDVGFGMSDVTISIYYVTENMCRHFFDDEKRREAYTKDGYVIEADIKAVCEENRTYIDEDYFNELYKRLNKIDFNLLSTEGEGGCDGWELEVQIGIFKGFVKYSKTLELWSPYIEDNDKSSELYQLLNIIGEIKDKINYHEWYAKWHEELENWKKGKTGKRSKKELMKFKKMFHFRDVIYEYI